MTGTFDPHDRNSWYFGMMTRQEAQAILLSEKDNGAFLVRDSNTILGNYVLCVKENNKVSHYIINKITNTEQQTYYKIGDKTFSDLPSLLAFYKVHYLDTSPLIKPATKTIEKVIAKYDFDGNDPDDLPFKKNDILIVVSKDEEHWWTAQNISGEVGSIPVPYVQKYSEGMSILSLRNLHLDSSSHHVPQQQTTPVRKTHLEVKLPAFARVKQVRVPNAYDKTALKLEIGDIIKVTKTNINGQWEGELNGKTGHFPFTHVEFIPTNETSVETNGNGDIHNSTPKTETPT
ncbi:hypothetical protein M8J77_016276 [Diaphorina citri]|nr:hypothetical protein M8J77_016276 [Diaphorina citri]